MDEAQDTSRLQHDILAKVARGELFLVGDEDQSIYGFRGAWPQGLVGFFQRYPGGRLLKLEEKKSVSEIAFSCGFNDSNYFSHKFKTVYGLSPLQFQKRCR